MKPKMPSQQEIILTLLRHVEHLDERNDWVRWIRNRPDAPEYIDSLAIFTLALHLLGSHPKKNLRHYPEILKLWIGKKSVEEFAQRIQAGAHLTPQLAVIQGLMK